MCCQLTFSVPMQVVNFWVGIAIHLSVVINNLYICDRDNSFFKTVLKVKRLGKEGMIVLYSLNQLLFFLLLLTVCIESRPGLECYILIEHKQAISVYLAQVGYAFLTPCLCHSGVWSDCILIPCEYSTRHLLC